ncbi:MAG: hypothetical protein IM488_18280 [Microcystis sp. M025S2]|uniref:hypothetical protein n=1 Tax=Microcystis sp. M025S2 TaxID=2771161 RepID=UPI0025906973|nr:hypothetical protein [Microcystis sp. M025S2]MCA2711276.1 hypothetical protein [Microcystis sp. M025S2]
MSIREKLSVVAAGTIKPYYPFTPVESLYYNKSGVQGPLENYQVDNTGEISLNTFAPNSAGTARIFNTDKLITNVWLELQFDKHINEEDNAGIMFYAYDMIESITYRIGGEERQTFYGYNLPFKWLQELNKDPTKYETFYKVSGPMTQGCLNPKYNATSSKITVPAILSATEYYNQLHWQGETSSSDYDAGTSRYDMAHVLLPLPQSTVGNRYINGVKPLPNYMTDKGIQIDVKFASKPVRKITGAKIKYTFMDTYKDDELKQVVYKYPYKHYYDDVGTLARQANADYEYSYNINSFKYGEVTQIMLRVESNGYVPFPGCSSKYFGVPLKDIKVECNNQVIYKSDNHCYPVMMMDSSDGIVGEVRPIFITDGNTLLTSAYNAGDYENKVNRLEGKKGYYYVIPLAPVLDADTHHDYSMGMSLLSKTLVIKFKLAADCGTAKTFTGPTVAADYSKTFPAGSAADNTLRVYTQTSYNAILQFDGRNVKFQT